MEKPMTAAGMLYIQPAQLLQAGKNNLQNNAADKLHLLTAKMIYKGIAKNANMYYHYK
ncbi:MAG: hypothetical protein ACOYID_07435 [Eubacteriales bacterium]|jgi:hypothetical protein